MIALTKVLRIRRNGLLWSGNPCSSCLVKNLMGLVFGNGKQYQPFNYYILGPHAYGSSLQIFLLPPHIYMNPKYIVCILLLCRDYESKTFRSNPLDLIPDQKVLGDLHLQYRSSCQNNWGVAVSHDVTVIHYVLSLDQTDFSLPPYHPKLGLPCLSSSTVQPATFSKPEVDFYFFLCDKEIFRFRSLW